MLNILAFFMHQIFEAIAKIIFNIIQHARDEGIPLGRPFAQSPDFVKTKASPLGENGKIRSFSSEFAEYCDAQLRAKWQELAAERTPRIAASCQCLDSLPRTGVKCACPLRRAFRAVL